VTRPTLQVQFRPGAGPFYDDTDDGGLDLPGEPFAWASTPDDAAFTVGTDELDVRVGVVIDDWHQADITLVGQHHNDADRAWRFQLLGSTGGGSLGFNWSPDGVNTSTEVSTVAPTPDSDGRLALRVVFVPDDGGGQHTVTFSTATARAGPYSALGSAVTNAGTTSVHDSSTAVGVGSYNGGLPAGTFRPMQGRVEWVEIRVGGVLVEDLTFTGLAAGTTAVTSDEGHVWSVHGGARIAEGRDFPWVTLTEGGPHGNRVEEVEWGYGRDDELRPFPPGDGSVVLKNDDRLFDPEHAGGDYYGFLNPRTPFRIRTTTNGVDFQDQFYGFVDGGFEQDYEPPGLGRCRVKLVDLLQILEGETLPRDAYTTEVMADRPVAWWRCDSTEGNEMTDSSGNGRHGVWAEVRLGDPLTVGDGRSAEFEHVGDWRGQAIRDLTTSAYPVSYECWVKAEEQPTEFRVLVMRAKDYSGTGRGLVIGASDLSPNGEALWFDSYAFRGDTQVDDGRIHHIVASIRTGLPADHKLYVDGVEQTPTVLNAGTGGMSVDERIWTIGNTPDTGGGDFGLTGALDDVAIYPTALSAARVQAHYEAGSTGYAGELSGERIDRVLDALGVPAALRDIDSGDTTVGPAIYGGATAGSYLQQIAESEQGYWFVDHHNGGKLTFRGRYHRLTDTRSTVVQWVLGDEDDPDALHVERDGLDVRPAGDSLINIVEVSWPGGDNVVARDGASIEAYGPESHSIATQAPTASAALGAGQWVINRHSRPQTRVRGFTLAPDGDERLWPVVVDLRPSTRVSLRRHPQEVGDPVTNELYVERVRHAVSGGLGWRTSVATSHADAADAAWIWGTSEWDLTTVWG
jgi:hypothetical protein